MIRRRRVDGYGVHYSNGTKKQDGEQSIGRPCGAAAAEVRIMAGYYLID
jgi:hypothetical protein